MGHGFRPRYPDKGTQGRSVSRTAALVSVVAWSPLLQEAHVSYRRTEVRGCRINASGLSAATRTAVMLIPQSREKHLLLPKSFWEKQIPRCASE